MSVLASDIVGFIGALLFLVAPSRDLLARWSLHQLTKRRASPMTPWWTQFAKQKDEQRNAFSLVDAATLGAGALLLCVSFALKWCRL